MREMKRGIFVAILGLLVGIFLYFVYFKGVATERCELLNLADRADNVEMLADGQTLFQKLMVNYNFDEILVDVEKYADTGSLEIIVQNAVSGSIEGHYCLRNEELKGNGIRIPFEGKRNQEYILIFSCIGMQAEDALVLYTTPSYSKYGTLSVNEIAVKNNLCMHVIKDTFLKKTIIYFFVLLLLVASILLVYYFLLIKKYKIEKVFLVSAMCLGLMYLLLFPPFTVEDEQAHFASAYLYANVLLGEETFSDNGNIMFRQSDVDGMENMGIVSSYKYWIQLAQGNDLYVGQQEMVDGKTSFYAHNGNIILFLPAVFGIVLARILRLGILPMILIAKLGNLSVYILLSYFAVKKAPFAKGFFALVALLPMALCEAGSLSYDSPTNGISFLFISYAMLLIYGRENIIKRDMYIICLLTFLLGMTKGGIYFLIAGILLMACSSLKNLFSKEKIWIWFSWGSGLLGYTVAKISNKLLLKAPAIVSRIRTEVVSYDEVVHYTLEQCIREPIKIIQILFRTFISEADEGISQMVGKYLSWHGVKVPMIMILIILFLLASILMYDVDRAPFLIPRWNKWWITGICFVIIMCVEVAMLLDMGVFDGLIRGVQGRYFLPIAPLALILCADKMNTNSEEKTRTIYWISYCIYALFLLFALLTVLKL